MNAIFIISKPMAPRRQATGHWKTSDLKHKDVYRPVTYMLNVMNTISQATCFQFSPAVSVLYYNAANFSLSNNKVLCQNLFNNKHNKVL